MITLKYLRDLYEAEKRSLKLQPLNQDFFKEVEEYIAFKKKIASKSNLKSYQTLKELENFKMLLKMLLEKREQKLISIAMRYIRSNFKVDKKAMLPSEIKFFEELVKLIRENEEQLNTLLEGDAIFEHSSDHELATAQEDPSKTEDTGDDEKDQHLSVQHEQTSLVKVKILEHVPSFLGENLEFLGPYEPNEFVFLPKQIAEVLIKIGKAKKL